MKPAMSSEEENLKRKVLEEKRKTFKHPAIPNKKMIQIAVPIKIKKPAKTVGI